MIKYENDCCGCAVPGYPCLGSSCPLTHSPHLYCDHCGYESEELYEFDGEELCEDCIKKRLPHDPETDTYEYNGEYKDFTDILHEFTKIL